VHDTYRVRLGRESHAELDAAAPEHPVSTSRPLVDVIANMQRCCDHLEEQRLRSSPPQALADQRLLGAGPVLLDADSERAVALTDLDTVKTGLLHYAATAFAQPATVSARRRAPGTTCILMQTSARRFFPAISLPSGRPWPLPSRAISTLRPD